MGENKGVTLYHNPNCGTSRNVLALLKERGIAPVVIEYMKTPPSLAALKALVKRSGLGARDFLRTREPLYGELDLANPKWRDEQLLEFIVKHPILLNRPVVATPKAAKPCRPAETVLELL